MSPAERTRKRRFAKYIVLLGSFYLWIMMSVMASVFEHSNNHQELVEKSFAENAVTIYGKVVFSSYNREVVDHKRLVSVAGKLSQNTTGYIVIVQFNDSAYNYHGLKGLYQHFNYYTHSKAYPNHIPAKDTNLSNCIQFSFKFPPSLTKVPALPVQGKYISLLYDPYENSIEMFTDSTSAVAPTFDSIPALSHQ